MRAWAVLLACAGAAAAIASCDDVSVHILTAQQFNQQYACVGPTAGVDVLQGGATGDNCDPTCLTATATTSDGNVQTFVYVTTTCPPYPTDYTPESQSQATDPTDPCTGAFAAYAGDAACPPSCTDGGPDVCIPTGDDGGDDGGSAGDDGGATGEGGGSSGDDAGTDAASE